jgi:hypothetical protein
VTDQLGPFQAIWEAWDDAHDEIVLKPLSHFRRAVEIQFDELDEHLRVGDRDAASREVMDIISVALNLMRRLGYRSEEVSDIARSRAERRMKGQVLGILEKYQQIYGI